jgi:RNA polymerase sigma factor (sigma-70 family)
MYHPSFDLDPRISEMIRFKAEKLANGPAFRRGDEEDIRQDLSLHLVERMRRHDPSRSSTYTYADRVLTNKVKDLVRRAHAQRRDFSRERRLEELPPRTLDDLHGHFSHVERQRDLRLDVTAALASLPQDDQGIALLLRDHSVAAATRLTGRSRQSVRTARGRVRKHLEACGVAP